MVSLAGYMVVLRSVRDSLVLLSLEGNMTHHEYFGKVPSYIQVSYPYQRVWNFLLGSYPYQRVWIHFVVAVAEGYTPLEDVGPPNIVLAG